MITKPLLIWQTLLSDSQIKTKKQEGCLRRCWDPEVNHGGVFIETLKGGDWMEHLLGAFRSRKLSLIWRTNV